MPLIKETIIIIRGVTCDTHQCDTTLTGDDRTGPDAAAAWQARALKAGWAIWKGQRYRYYCPTHKPTDPTHHMHPVRLKAGTP